MSKDKKTTKSTVAKVASVVGIVTVSALAGAVGHALTTEPVTVEKIVNQTVEVPVEKVINATQEQLETAFNEGVASVEPTVEVKEVDNENLKVVLQEIYDQDGNVEYLTEDLDDDEVSQIADRLIFKIEAEKIAEDLVKETVVEYIDDEENIFRKGDLKDFRDNDVYKVTVDEDETVFEVEDFDDKEATVFVEAKLKLDNDDDKETVYVIAEVEIEGDKAEIVNVELKE